MVRRRNAGANNTAALRCRLSNTAWAFYLGYAEKFEDETGVRRFNTSILVDKSGQIVGKYRKVHLPGHVEYDDTLPWQHLEKRYFEVGDLGWPVWRTMGGVMGMALCNDRRWPETYRVMGLQGVELVMLGYNTPTGNSRGPEAPHLRMMHNHMSMQMGAYQNGTWVVGVAKAGSEDGFELMGGSVIVAPSGEIVAQARTLGDEVIVADADLDACTFQQDNHLQFRRSPQAGTLRHYHQPGGCHPAARGLRPHATHPDHQSEQHGKLHRID